MSTACVDRSHLLARLRQQLPPELASQLTTSAELLRRKAEGSALGAAERFPTGFALVDGLLGGGVRRGSFAELVGRGSSGRFTLGLSVLASATQMGEPAALVDIGDHLDTRAAEAQGIELARLLWLRPRALKQALAVAELVLGTGFPLVVVDVGLGGRMGRVAATAWLRLSRAAKAHRGALLLLSDAPRSGTAADVVLGLRAQPVLQSHVAVPTAPRRSPPPSLRQPRHSRCSLLAGLSTDVTLLRQRRGEAPLLGAARPGETVSLLLTPYAIQPPAERPRLAAAVPRRLVRSA